MSELEVFQPQVRLERRRARRLRLRRIVTVSLGRGDAILVDISTRGARVLHPNQLPLGGETRLVLLWEGRHFAATAEVLSSHLVSLCDDGRFPSTTYESRLHFLVVSGLDAKVLQAFLQATAARDGLARSRPPAFSSFVRCVLEDRWRRQWTHDSPQPNHGFTVPAEVTDGELDELSLTYATCSETMRKLIRDTAAVVCDTALEAQGAARSTAAA